MGKFYGSFEDKFMTFDPTLLDENEYRIVRFYAAEENDDGTRDFVDLCLDPLKFQEPIKDGGSNLANSDGITINPILGKDGQIIDVTENEFLVVADLATNYLSIPSATNLDDESCYEPLARRSDGCPVVLKRQKTPFSCVQETVPWIQTEAFSFADTGFRGNISESLGHCIENETCLPYRIEMDVQISNVTGIVEGNLQAIIRLEYRKNGGPWATLSDTSVNVAPGITQPQTIYTTLSGAAGRCLYENLIVQPGQKCCYDFHIDWLWLSGGGTWTPSPVVLQRYDINLIGIPV